MLGESPVTRKITKYIQDAMLGLGGAPGLVKLSIDDPGDGGAREACKDFVIAPDKPADHLALEIEHEAQERADGEGRGVHRFRLQFFQEHAPKAFKTGAFQLVADGALEDETPTAVSQRTLLTQAYAHLEAEGKKNERMIGLIVHGMGTMITALSTRLEAHERNAAENMQIAHSNAVNHAKLEFDIETRKALLEITKGIAAIAAPVLVPKLIEKYAGDSADDAVRVIPNQSVTAEPAPLTLPPTTDVPLNGHAINGHKKKVKAKEKTR